MTAAILGVLLATNGFSFGAIILIVMSLAAWSAFIDYLFG